MPESSFARAKRIVRRRMQVPGLHVALLNRFQPDELESIMVGEASVAGC